MDRIRFFAPNWVIYSSHFLTQYIPNDFLTNPVWTGKWQILPLERNTVAKEGVILNPLKQMKELNLGTSCLWENGLIVAASVVFTVGFFVQLS